MKICNKYITVEFMGGEHIYNCISQAQEFAIKNYVTVKFKFNGVLMTLTPDSPASVWFDKKGQLFKTAKKDWEKYIEPHYQEYHKKSEQLKARSLKKINRSKKENAK